jgi:flagellin
MAFDILTNISSLQSQNYLNANTKFQAQTINEVTSGQRIVNAGDDAAGLAVANTFRSDEAVLTQGIRNANDGLSTLQTIDGGMSNISQLLDRASTLAAQSASQTFQGQRTVLDNEFQNVLAEINRQAQSIGMTQGGTFAQKMQVFIGGGRTDGTQTTAADAIQNGSVTVDLSSSLLDTNSLGLSANGVAGGDMRSSSTALSSAIADATTTPANAVFKFTGAGFTGGVTVDFSAALLNAKTGTDVANAINTAIQSAAVNNTSFAGANIRASVDSTTGNLVFTGSSAFAVKANAGGTTGAAGLLLGGTASNLEAANASVVSTLGTTGVTTNNQILTFSWRDSAGALQSQTVTLTAGSVATPAAAAADVNAATNMGGIFAVDNGAGAVIFMKSDGGAFSVTSAGGGTGTGTGVTPGTYGSSSTPLGTAANLNILDSTSATTAITSLTAAVSSLGQIQGTVGRAENQLGYAINLAQSQNTNLAASEAQIRDADMAAEAANLTKAQILVQAGTAALAQANSAPQAVLALLKG